MSGTVDIVRDLFRLFEEQGVEGVLAVTPDDVVWAPLGAEGRTYVGPEIRGYFAQQRAAGSAQTQRLVELEQHGDAVVARGSVQIRARDRHVDLQPTWTYEFEGDRLVRATGHPTHASALRYLASATGQASTHRTS